MRTLLVLSILALCFCNPCIAGKNFHGAMLVHTNDEITYSTSWDYCSQNPLPPGCLDLVTVIGKPLDDPALVWVVGAFAEGSGPCVTAYQLGIYHNLPAGSFLAWGPCGPAPLELPDAAWPEVSGTGTAIAYGGQALPHYIFKMYWFAVTGVHDGSISTGPYPHGTNEAQFEDDLQQIDAVHMFGTVRWLRGGRENECPLPYGACCFTDGHCDLLSADECAAQGGTYLGNFVSCEPENPCPTVPVMNTSWSEIKLSYR
jgi:hypothetical protein